MTLRFGARNDSPIRQYRPKVGQLVTMGNFADYTERNIHPWGKLRVVGIDHDTVTVRHAPAPMDASQDTEQFTIPLTILQMPVGWEPRYTIHVQPSKVNEVLSWMKRGIVVRQSHDMSGSMPTAFQPLTDGQVPGASHWQFCEDTDVVMAEDCERVFKVVAVEVEEITNKTLGYPPDPNCVHCGGKGRRTVKELADVRQELPEVTRIAVATGKLSVDDYQSESDSFRCFCADSGALTRMGRTKRAKLFNEMRADGWTVEYRPYAGGFWERTRERVVKDWQ